AIAVGVDHDANIRGAVWEDDALRKVLDGVDRLPVPADEQPYVLAMQAAAEHGFALLDVNLNIETQAVRDLPEELFQRLGGPDLLADRVVCALAFAHRRLPERFFFLRGARGGGEELAPRPLTPARAGSPFGPFPLGASGFPLGEPRPPGSGPFPGGAAGAPMCRRITSCCPIVQRFVVIQ